MRAGEVPVFWACGVTPQAVIEQAAAAVRDHARARAHVRHRRPRRRPAQGADGGSRRGAGRTRVLRYGEGPRWPRSPTSRPCSGSTASWTATGPGEWSSWCRPPARCWSATTTAASRSTPSAARSPNAGAAVRVPRRAPAERDAGGRGAGALRRARPRRRRAAARARRGRGGRPAHGRLVPQRFLRVRAGLRLPHRTGRDAARAPRDDPRTKVPAGSVALADEFTAIYPRVSPGAGS